MPLWRSWWSEMALCTVGVSSFIAVIVVLGLHDQKKQPDWGLNITLNALIALLATISKASFMLALAEATCQWKWIIFTTAERGRVLQDFSLIDLASRGFWGSCIALARFRWRHPISVAAAITMVSVITSPITQQAIAYSTRSAGTYGQSSIPTARRWSESTTSGLLVAPVYTAFAEGLYSNAGHRPSPIDAVCPTAHCSLPRYQSLAVCAKAKDISHLLDVTTRRPETRPTFTPGSKSNVDDEGRPTPTYYTTLPNNVTFDTNYPFQLISQPGNATLAFADDDAYATTFSNFFVTYTRAFYNRTDNEADWGFYRPSPEFRAIEVILYVCVNEYETEVKQGTSRTVITSSVAKPLPGEDGKVTEVPKIQCYIPPWNAMKPQICENRDVWGGHGTLTLAAVNDSIADANLTEGDGSRDSASNSNSTSFDVHVGILFGMAERAVSTMLAQIGSFNSPEGRVRKFYSNNIAYWMAEALYGPALNVTDPQQQLRQMQDYYDGIATSISNQLRLSDSAETVVGTAWETEVFVNVRWGWLIFLGGELVLATLFLLFTTVATHRSAVPVLKSSSTAALLALDGNVRQTLGSLEGLPKARERAGQTHVRFDGMNLVTATEDSPEPEDSLTAQKPPAATE